MGPMSAEQTPLSQVALRLLERERRDTHAETRGVDVWHPQGIAPQLQAESYARAVLHHGHGHDQPQQLLEPVVRARMWRVSQLAAPRAGVTYRIVLADYERTPPGASERTMGQAFSQVADLTRLDHLTVRVLPKNLRANLALTGVGGMSLYPNHTATTQGPEGPMAPIEGEMAARARFATLWQACLPYPG